MAARDSIKMLNSTIDVVSIPPNPETNSKAREMLVIRGVLDPDSYTKIQSAPYQREVMGGRNARELRKAVKTSMVPDIELGMRGDKHRLETDGTCYLQDPTFVIDGLQRISAAICAIDEDPTLRPHIGCVVFLDTDETWERDRFRILNQERTKLNASVLVRNLRHDNDAIQMLYKLATEEEKFVLKDKIAWTQRMNKGELIPALVFCQVVGNLHSQFGPGRSKRVDEIASQLEKLMTEVGRTTMRDNIVTFFDLIDECFNLRHVVMVDAATCIRRNFLVSLAEILTRHSDFWRGKRLFVEADLRRKIAKFPLRDPSIGQLASGSGAAREILYQTLLTHINSGKRTKRLTAVDGMEPKDFSTDSQSNDNEDNAVETEEAVSGK